MRMPPPSSSSTQARTKQHSRSASASAVAGGPAAGPAPGEDEPRTVADLNKLSKINFEPAQNPVKRWCNSASNMFDKAEEAKIANNTDDHYILLMKGVNILLDMVKKHKDFKATEQCYREVEPRMIRYIDELTELQKKVDARHAEWEKRQLVSKPATSGPPTQPAPAKPNAILSPTMSSTRFSTTNSNMPENQPFGSSKFPNQTVNNATFGSRNSVPSPPHTQLAQQQQQSLPPANDLAARLKALGPASSAGSNNTAPPPPRVLPKQSSSFLDSSSPAGLKPSPSSSSLKSLPPQPPQPAVPLKRESSNGPTSVPPLSRSPSSGSGLGTVGPGTGAGRVIQNRTMSAGDLYLGLAGQEKDNTTKVLVVDVRPMEEYVQGHVRWPDEKRKASAVGAGEVSSGLVHLEPDWIHPGVETDHIVHCLRGFTTATDPRPMLFDYRHMFNLIVIYDARSTSVHASPMLTALVNALYVADRARPLAYQPILLEGGFEAWETYLRQKREVVANWVEIGDGVGGAGPRIAAPPSAPSPVGGGPPSVSPSTSGAGVGGYTGKPGRVGPAPPPPKPVGYVDGAGYPQSTYGGLQGQYGVYGNVGTGLYLPQQQQQQQQQRYLNSTAFDNPFATFTSSKVNVGAAYQYPAYPMLPNQIPGRSLSPSPSFVRQASFPLPSAVGGGADYPTLGPLTSSMGVGTGTIAVPPTIPQKPTIPSLSAVGSSPKLDAAKMVQQQQFLAAQQQQLQQAQIQQAQIQQVQLQQQLQQQQQTPAILQQQQLPPPTPAKPPAVAALAKKSPPPLPVKPRLSITSVEYQQTSPAYSNPADFISISALGSSNIGVVGLKNLGNTCFMNSTLQCLSGTVPLARYFLGGNYRRGINRANPMGTKGVLVEEFAQVIKAMWSGQESIVTPAQFKERVGEFADQFKGTEQHDSQEFLTFLLDTIHEDLNIARGAKSKQIDTKGTEDETIPDEIRQQMAWNNYRSNNWSIIVDLFQGQLKSKLECLTCNSTSTTFNPFMYLSVPIPPSNSAGVKGGPVYLDECLDKFVEVEILDGEDAWSCPKCKVKRRSRKTLTIAKLPPILLVHLKRFYYQGPFKSKIETYVDFPLASMDLGKYSGGGAVGSVYDLYAVSNHTGTLGSGHYTATVHNSTKKAWYNFSDTRVGVCDVNELKTNSAYILYYVRKSSANQAMTSVDWWKS